MFKVITLLVLVIALISGAMAQEERAPVAAAPASAPLRAGPPSPSAAPAAKVGSRFLFRTYFPNWLSFLLRDLLPAGGFEACPD